MVTTDSIILSSLVPASLAGTSFLSCTFWLIDPISDKQRQLYHSFTQSLCPTITPQFHVIGASPDHLSTHLGSSFNPEMLHIVDARLIKYWPNNIPFLPCPIVVGIDFIETKSNDHTGSAIVFFGPESTGKSTVSTQLATAFKLPLVTEYVRLWFDIFGCDCNRQQAWTILNVVHAFHQAINKVHQGIWLADTDALASLMWLEWYFGVQPTASLPANLVVDKFYLLCGDDIPFVPDHQRRYSDKREFDAAFAKSYLQKFNADFEWIKGQGVDRLEMAKRYLETKLEPS